MSTGEGEAGVPGDQSRTAFPELEEAAKDAAKDPGVVNPGIPGGEKPSSLQDTYEAQVRKNMEAHRRMRAWAFGFVGVIVLAFFVILMGAFCKFFLGANDIESSLVIDGVLQWHVLAMMSAALILFAAIPLSLCLAVLKMISDKSEEPSSEIKAPSVELIKALAEIVKSVAESIRQK